MTLRGSFGRFLLVLGVVLACVLASVPGDVQAIEIGDVVIELKPAEQEFTMVPGGVYAGSLTVTNAGRLSFGFTVSTRPYSASSMSCSQDYKGSDNYCPDYTTESDYAKLSNWINFDQTSYEVAPGEVATVEFRIRVPEDVPGGGQYAAIIVETRDGIDETSAVRQVNQLAELLYGRVDDGTIREDGTVVEQKLPKIVLGGDFSAYEVTKNTGNVDLRVVHSVSVVDFFTGKEVFSPDSYDDDGDQIGSVRQLIFPGTERSSTITWLNTPKLGVYRVTETVNFLDQDYSYEQMVFVIPVWLVVLIGSFIVLMIIWAILRIRRRRKGRPQVI